MKNTKYTSAILITGPEQEDFLIYRGFLEKTVGSVITIGDGKSNIAHKNGFVDYQNITTLTDLSIGARPLVMVASHGQLLNGKHILGFGNIVETSSLFKSLSDILNQPIDIILTACHGDGANYDIHHLPKGSKLLTFASDHQVVWIPAIKHSLETYPQDKLFSLKNLYEHFLMTVSSFHAPNFIDTSPNGLKLNPYHYFNKKLLQKNLPDYIKHHLNIKFPEFCTSEETCANILKAAFEQITTISNLDNFILQQQTYWPCLFKLYQTGELKNKFGNIGINSFSTKLKLLENTTQIAETIAGLLTYCKIPLTFNVESFMQAINILDSDSDCDEKVDIDLYMRRIDKLINTQFDDYFFLNTFTDWTLDNLFELNDKFPHPERSDYGQVLLISSLVQEYCQTHTCPDM